MNTTTLFEEVLASALKLTPKDRLQLVEQINASLESENEPVTAHEEQPEEHWGKSLNRLMDEIGTIEMKSPEIEDPVEWVKAQRRKRVKQLQPYREEE